MEKLLGHLAQFGSFSKQGELLCTQGLSYLLKDAGGDAALRAVIESLTRTTLPERLEWIAEAVQVDRGRPDLEGCAPGGIPKVKVEGKLGAVLSPEQFRSYASDLHRRSPGGGVIIALVPNARIREASAVIVEAFLVSGASPWRPGDHPGVAVAVVSWDDVFAALKQTGSDRFREEVEQLEAMYRVLSGFHIEPLATVEALLQWRERETDFVNLVERASRRLTTLHNIYPMQRELSEQTGVGLEPKGYHRRYVQIDLGAFKPFFSLGVRDPFAGHFTPVWMRFNRATPGFQEVQARLESSKLRAGLVHSDGHLWIPLDVPLDVTGDAIVNALVAESEAVIRVIQAMTPESA